jgi:SAM-dependent methyltransferase
MPIAARVAALLLALIAVGAFAQTPALQYGDEIYRPRLRQPGKDVMWLPTPEGMVKRMLEAAKVTAKDLVYDLGAGEGKIPIAAARDFKARAVGIEYNPDMAALAKRNAERAGVADNVKIIAGDIFENDFSEATVVTLYLLPELNMKLRPSILKMKPGTRVVSHAFNMRDWEPDDVIYDGEREAFLWIVPATIAGKWQFDEGGGGFKGTLDLIQAYQRVGGNMAMGKQLAPILGPKLLGNNFSFSFINSDGTMRSVRGKFDGDKFDGWMRLEGYDTPISARRVAAAQRKA